MNELIHLKDQTYSVDGISVGEGVIYKDCLVLAYFSFDKGVWMVGKSARGKIVLLEFKRYSSCSGRIGWLVEQAEKWVDENNTDEVLATKILNLML